MTYWIFQAVEERYPLREKLQEGRRETWYATRYRNDMKTGDIVFFWLGGSRDVRGIYGWGRLESEPYIKPAWDAHGVDVVYETRLSQYIPIEEIESTEELSELLVLRAPQATNFHLSNAEGKAIIDLMDPGERPQEVDRDA